ncbi:hypothetical protein K435DRAFT_606689, partial [Dendrothele bispora CBS 962.96]
MTQRKTPGHGKGYSHVPGMIITRNTIPAYIPPKPGAKAIWTILDVIEACNFLVPHIPASGDRRKFGGPVLKLLTAHLNQRIIAGGEKKVATVRTKVSEWLSIFDAVEYLKLHVSGIHWDDELGANITTEAEERVWDTIVASHPNCYPFKNSGWPVYDDVLKLCPEKQKG